MSRGRDVISHKNLPFKAPVLLSLVIWLLLDRFHSPGWVWGAIAVVLLLYWIVWAVDRYESTAHELRPEVFRRK